MTASPTIAVCMNALLPVSGSTAATDCAVLGVALALGLGVGEVEPPFPGVGLGVVVGVGVGVGDGDGVEAQLAPIVTVLPFAFTAEPLVVLPVEVLLLPFTFPLDELCPFV